MPPRPTNRALLTLADQGGRLDDARRQLLADWCRLVGGRLSGRAVESPHAGSAARPTPAEAVAALGLPPRMRQILVNLLAGQSEKQVARTLSISPHTVHTYVKQLHKRLDVSSRGELLARFMPGTASDVETHARIHS